MFRIDRNLVNLATARSVQVDGDDSEVGAEGVPYNATTSVNYMAQEMIKSAEAKAAAIIDDARNEKAALMLTAREEAEEARRAAWQEGYAEGAEEGRRAAEKERLAAEEGRRTAVMEYEKKAQEDDEMLKRVIGELYEERERTYSGLEDEIVGMSLDIVKKVINPAEETLGGVFESLIRNALRQIAPEGKVVIRVSPAEYERFFSSGSAVFHLDKGVTVTASVLRDASLSEADCIIDTEDETVNAGLDTQLKYIKIAFNRAND